MSTKINRSELWKQVKSIGNIGTLRWQSKTSEWQSFINSHYEALEEAERIRSFPVTEGIIIDRDAGDGEALKRHILAQPVNSIIVVNNKQFTYTGNVNALIG
jgi:hypothetical protein